MEFCCHVWAGAPNCYLELLDMLQKQICRTVGPSLAASLEPPAHYRNVASLTLFSIGITLVDVHLNWLNWFHFLILEKQTNYLGIYLDEHLTWNFQLDQIKSQLSRSCGLLAKLGYILCQNRPFENSIFCNF